MKRIYTLIVGLLAAFSSLAALPNKVFAPYVDVMLWPTFSLMSCFNATGQKYYTLAFITAGSNGQPAWGGSVSMDQNFMLDQINQLRASGGDVIVSFGGANGTPIDASITDVNALVNAYQSVINRYGLTWIDFDVEGFWVADQPSIDRRNQAARILQNNNPGLRITYCLPVMPTGLTADGINVINKAKAAGVNIYNVNVMAMDYGQSVSQMGSAAISAAQNARSQTGLNIGITPMIGKNDTQNETFTLANATEVLNFANANGFVNMIAMWSANRDNGGCPGQTTASPSCSGLSQGNFAFINTWKSFSGGTISGVATLYKDCNFSGSAVALPVGDYTLSALNARGVLNDDISSVRVTSGYKITLYEHDNFGGASIVVTGENSCLVGAGWNDRASSIRVATNTGSFSTTVQAENWTFMSGVQTETTQDPTGGGLNVGWIDAGDWMAYNVTIPSTGTYRVIYRVASPNSGRTLRLEKDAGSTQLGSVTVPNTGSWQSWTNVAHNVTLTAGTYSIGIATATGGFNINYFTITNNLSARLSTNEHAEHENPVSVEEHVVMLFPNPVRDQLFIRDFENVKAIRIYNIQGQELIVVEKPGPSVPVGVLKPGMHIGVIEKTDGKIMKEKLVKE
ncbi:MAG TPA: carbohydrate-binding protein [Chryseosolibacter sp.]|nr:carbohydrate-binding protein [Chryseosolibacter sp.]